jgi:competence protein ComEA
MRAGLAFVLISLALGTALRAWQRAHEMRFAEIVESLVESDLADRERVEPQRLAGKPPVLSPAAHAAALRPASINLDRAAASELVRLPGIGPALAARIVADREARGPFGEPDGLLRVPGIGRKTLAKIRPYLTSTPAEGSPAAN